MEKRGKGQYEGKIIKKKSENYNKSEIKIEKDKQVLIRTFANGL